MANKVYNSLRLMNIYDKKTLNLKLISSTKNLTDFPQRNHNTKPKPSNLTKRIIEHKIGKHIDSYTYSRRPKLSILHSIHRY